MLRPGIVTGVMRPCAVWVVKESAYTPRVGDKNTKSTGRPHVGRWLGGFGGAGAIVAGGLAAFFDLGFLPSLGIAVLGAILGIGVGVGIAEAVLLLADVLGWDERPQNSRIGRLVRYLDRALHDL